MKQMSKQKLFGAIFLLAIASILTFCSLNYSLYQQTIATVQTVQTKQIDEKNDAHSNTEKHFSQKLELLIKNGTKKGQIIQTDYQYSESQITHQKINKNDVLFVKLSESDLTIIDFKRDTLLIVLTFSFMILLLLVAHTSGIRMFTSTVINGIILTGILLTSEKLADGLLLPIFIVMIPLMIALSMIISNGYHSKTKVTILTSIIGTYATFFVGWLVITLLNHRGLHYEEMELVTRPPHLIFLTSLLIGSLGGVMDIAMTISSALFEIKEQKPLISKKELTQAGQTIGQEILGPMTNIMVFSYLSGAIPLIIIFLKNNMSFTYTFSITLSLEITRALVGCIGIILTIPLTIYVLTTIIERQGEFSNDC